VIPYEKPIETNGLVPENHGEWLSEIHCENGKHIPWRWPQDIQKILDFDYEPCSPPPCVMVTHRVRGWCKNRNCEASNTKSFISMVMDMGYKPYIGGKYAEGVDDRAEYVPSLRSIASIVNHRNCVAIIASGGPSLLAQQCCRSKLLCLKTCGDSNPWGEHPLYISKFLNFSGCQQFLVSPNDVNAARKIIMGESHDTLAIR
jgi:hypothetical protein